jgi:DMSO reductase anchor subunit
LIEGTELFVALAEIAGIFVGFGALISVARGSDVEQWELWHIRGVVTIGLTVLVAGLLPVGLARYGVDDRVVWIVSSIVYLALVWASIFVSLRRQEGRQLTKSATRENPLLSGFFWLVLEVALQLPLLLVIFGLFPDLDPALYTTALIVSLFEAAFILARLVYRQGQPVG